MIGVSRSTLYRRLEEEGISKTITYTDITEQALDHIIYRIKLQHPNDGERMMMGYLASQNVRVTRSRLRASIHRIDPVNTALRRSIVIQRRRYHSPGTNAVWHIDGNHKMTRWHLVIHGGIDGFSRTVVFLKCSDNNRASTLLEAFTEATGSYDVPSKIRTDCGGENTAIWRFMIHHHSSTSSVITSSSVHNERIERLWRDVTRSVSSIFIDLFRSMEEEGILDPMNKVDIFCLHWVYLPLLNKTLEEFRESWNNHPLSSEHNQTPNQLFCQGLLTERQLLGHQSSTINVQLPVSTNSVTVPSNCFVPCSALQTTLNTLLNHNNFTIRNAPTKYDEVASIVGQHVVQNCNVCELIDQ